uniref:Uncharacterized protein n=1 Tax=Timema genevievae TaxID=629358 RepID=A0A7R9K3B9_TIMGE|nr:unnamed protein product [Timema genevievae]
MIEAVSVLDVVLEISVKSACQMQTHSSSLEMIDSEGDAYRIVLKGRGVENEENKDQLELPVVRRNMKTGEEVTVARINILETTTITDEASSRNYHQPCATDNVAWNSIADLNGKTVGKRKKKKNKELNFSETGKNESVEIGTTEQRSSNDSKTFESDINENTVIKDDRVSERNTTDLESLNMSLCNLNNLNQSTVSKKECSPLYEATHEYRLPELENIGRELENTETKSKRRKHKKTHSIKAQSSYVFDVDSPFLSKPVTDHVFERGINENSTSTKNAMEQTQTNYESADMSLTSQNNFNQPTISKSKLLLSCKQTSEPAPLNSEDRKNSLTDTEEIKSRKRKRKRVHSKKSKRLHGLSLAETISLLSKATVDPENLIKKQELNPRASDHKHIRFSDSTRDEEKANNLEASLDSSNMTPMKICTSLTSNNIASAAKSSRLVNKSHNLVSNFEEPLDQSNMSLCSEKSFFEVNSRSVSPEPLCRAVSLPSSNYSEPDVSARLGGNLESKWDIKYPAPMRPTNQSTETFGNLLSLRHTSAPCVFKRKQSIRESAQNDGAKNVSTVDQPQGTVSCNQETIVQPKPENSHTSVDEMVKKRRNCLLHDIIEGKVEGRSRIQILDELKERRKFWELKEEAEFTDKMLVLALLFNDWANITVTHFGRRMIEGDTLAIDWTADNEEIETLVLTEDCVPRLSADITAIVQEYFPSTSEVELKILSGSEQLQQSVKKFSIGDEDIEPCNIVLLNWNEMIEPKLIN